MLLPPASPSSFDGQMRDPRRIYVAERCVPALFSAMFGPLRFGERGSAGHPVEVVAAEHGVELVSLETLDLTPSSGELALWWSVGDARMEFAATATEHDGAFIVALAGSPQRVQERNHRRVRIEVPLWVHVLETAAILEATTSNLSVGGLAFAVGQPPTRTALDVGDAVVVVVPQLQTGPVGAAGTIVRATSQKSYSVAFTALGAAEESRISSAITTAESRYAR
ncbi:MAG: PilZ domain-containing protein [Actinobacteria bacterium]|nr:PilZ domain-containing protein [Actinomycetota bacterium]